MQKWERRRKLLFRAFVFRVGHDGMEKQTAATVGLGFRV